jgi:hypothetical protein
MNYIVDFESLGTKQNSVLLSMGVIAFDPLEPDSFTDLVDRGLFLKFDVEQQITEMGRKVDKETAMWWNAQDAEAKKVLKPNKCDVSLNDAMDHIKEYVSLFGEVDDKEFVWSRGYLDPCWYFSLPDVDKEVFAFHRWRDVRTCIDVLADTSEGFLRCGFPEGYVKHNPVHDCAKDILVMKKASLGEF